MRLEIADRKMAETALRQNKEQLQRYITAIDDIGLGLCVINADYRLQVMNSTLKSWFGNHLGKTCYSSLMGGEHPCEQCKMQDVIKQGKKVRYHPSIRDITEQKRRERPKMKTLQHREQLKKLESLKTMAAAIAHRFNNAMTGVQANLELLTLNLSKNSKEYTMATDAFRGAKEASLVGSIMLSYVGQQALQSKEVSLEELVRSTVTSSENLFHPQVDVKFIPPQQPLYCSIDRLQINEAIENNLTNAMES